MRFSRQNITVVCNLKTEKKRDFRANCTFTGPYKQLFHEKAYGQYTARFSLGRQPFKVKRFAPEGNI